MSAVAKVVPGFAGAIPRKTFVSRLQAVCFCVFAFMYAWLADALAGSAASGLSSPPWFELVYRSMLLFLLLAGFWAMGYVFQRQRTPLKSMGLIRRATAVAEFGTGAAFGWGAMLVCILPMAILGGFTITFWTGSRQFGLIVLDLAILLVAALAEEVVFRGYPFQRLIDGVGPVLATLIASAVFAMRHLANPDSSLASTLVTILAGWLFAMAYLRTRALWLPWGLHFAWNASMGILFGLPISGLRIFSPVISTNAHGPLWLTGDGYGPEGSAVAAVVLFAALGLMMLVTRDYAWHYAQPVIVPGGIAVDIDAAAARQHDEAMASPAEAAAPKLVQIFPAGGVVVTSSEPATRVDSLAEPALSFISERPMQAGLQDSIAEASPAVQIRVAQPEDIPALHRLIEASVRGLQAGDYTPSQIEGALGGVLGLDTQLVGDRTYFVAESHDATGQVTIVGSGGWSYRKTLFGSDHGPGREAILLDPATEPARIRAIFVHPDWARRGIGSQILQHCEEAAMAAGFHSFEMGSTLTGVPLYLLKGYTEIERIAVPLPNGEAVQVVRMSKNVKE